MKRKLLNLVLGLGVMGVLGSAQAALIDRGGGMIYDDVLKITWLKDANYAKTSSYDPDGRMSWSDANAWATSLNISRFAGESLTGWRLPTMVDTGTSGCNFALTGTDCGYNVQTVDTSTDPDTVYSEMAYMSYVNLGLKALFNPDGSDRTDWGIFGNGTCNGADCTSFGQNDVGLIDNLQASVYWSGLENAANSDSAWVFNTNSVSQSAGPKFTHYYAWAVRPGDVAAVPEPSTLVLLGLAMAGLGALRRRG